MNEPARIATIHPTVFIAPGAVVLGDVTLEARSSVWFNTVIRGDSDRVVVGKDTNLQDNSVVHEDEGFPTLIGDRVTVGHRSIIHGCVIEHDCLIGMGSVILSGARIGTGSLIGASSLVRENQTIPPGSLVVGSPARVVGPASAQHRASIQNGSAHYAELARFYMMRGLARGANRRGEVAETDPPMTAREWERRIAELGGLPLENDPMHREALIDLVARDQVRRARIQDALRGDDLAVMGGISPEKIFPAHPYEAFTQGRRELTELLEPLDRDHWVRPMGHPTRGARTLADWVREWAEDDIERCREMGRLTKGRK